MYDGLFLLLGVLIHLLPLSFLLRLLPGKKIYSARSFYLVSIVALLTIPFQQLYIGAFSLGCIGGFSWWSCYLTESGPLIAILALVFWWLLAFRLFWIAEKSRLSYEYNILRILNVVLGIVIIFGYLFWDIHSSLGIDL